MRKQNKYFSKNSDHNLHSLFGKRHDNKIPLTRYDQGKNFVSHELHPKAS